MVCAPVRRDNPRALARGLSTVLAHKPCSISLVPHLHSTEYLLLKIGYLWNVVQLCKKCRWSYGTYSLHIVRWYFKFYHVS